MSSDADTFIRSGLARGLQLETIIDAARSQLAAASSPSAEESSSADGEKTELWWDGLAKEDPSGRVSSSTAAESPPVQSGIAGLSRYADLGLIGKGGMGDVHRVFDRRLGRQLALKIIQRSALDHPALVGRFLEEAQTTSQLQHPGIIPIYDLGSLPDGRVWFTMKEVSGKTLGEVISEVHAVSRVCWRPAESGWTLRRMIDALRQVCEAVGYAHSRGVVHRDLKPSNVMVGRHGEVMVLDWGLVKVLGRPGLAAEDRQSVPVQTNRSRDGIHHTVDGLVAGTPAYMPPEQALGRNDEIDARSDVYALGAMLYKVLSGRSPYSGMDSTSVLDQVRSGPPASLRNMPRPGVSLKFGLTLRPDARREQGPLLPLSLLATCERAMAREPEDRFASAMDLAAELQAWLEGSKRQEEARAVVSRARDKQPEAASLRQRAVALRAEAAALLKGVETWRPEEDKRPGWDKEDEAAALEKQAELAELEEEQLLQGSLTHFPDLPEAHAALAARYRAEHEAAEATRQDTTRAETLFRQHLAALPADHADRVGHFAYLSGDGALSLVTDPPGAEVLLHRHELYSRRLVPRFVRSLGKTPLRGVSLAMGSYLCVLRHPDRADVRYPVSIGRGEHWHGVPPEGGGIRPIPLPRRGELGPDDCYMPAGWFQCGGDPLQSRSLPAQRIWVDGQVFRRFPVTNRQYLAFLDALVASGQAEAALRHAPRERAGTAGDQGALIYGFDGRRFSLRPDVEGDLWELDWPVIMVDWHGARAFAAWEATRKGEAWRLPGELAWEKAARGVDGRFHPWGDGLDPSWTCMRQSHQGRAMPAEVGAFPIDESVYGIRGMAGNVLDWCDDLLVEGGPPLSSARHASAEVAGGGVPPREDDLSAQGALRVYRGGNWYSATRFLRSAYRFGYDTFNRTYYLGLRLARSYSLR